MVGNESTIASRPRNGSSHSKDMDDSLNFESCRPIDIAPSRERMSAAVARTRRRQRIEMEKSKNNIKGDSSSPIASFFKKPPPSLFQQAEPSAASVRSRLHSIMPPELAAAEAAAKYAQARQRKATLMRQLQPTNPAVTPEQQNRTILLQMPNLSIDKNLLDTRQESAHIPGLIFVNNPPRSPKQAFLKHVFASRASAISGHVNEESNPIETNPDGAVSPLSFVSTSITTRARLSSDRSRRDAESWRKQTTTRRQKLKVMQLGTNWEPINSPHEAEGGSEISFSGSSVGYGVSIEMLMPKRLKSPTGTPLTDMTDPTTPVQTPKSSVNQHTLPNVSNYSHSFNYNPSHLAGDVPPQDHFNRPSPDIDTENNICDLDQRPKRRFSENGQGTDTVLEGTLFQETTSSLSSKEKEPNIDKGAKPGPSDVDISYEYGSASSDEDDGVVVPESEAQLSAFCASMESIKDDEINSKLVPPLDYASKHNLKGNLKQRWKLKSHDQQAERSTSSLSWNEKRHSGSVCVDNFYSCNYHDSEKGIDRLMFDSHVLHSSDSLEALDSKESHVLEEHDDDEESQLSQEKSIEKQQIQRCDKDIDKVTPNDVDGVVFEEGKLNSTSVNAEMTNSRLASQLLETIGNTKGSIGQNRQVYPYETSSPLQHSKSKDCDVTEKTDDALIAFPFSDTLEQMVPFDPTDAYNTYAHGESGDLLSFIKRFLELRMYYISLGAECPQGDLVEGADHINQCTGINSAIDRYQDMRSCHLCLDASESDTEISYAEMLRTKMPSLSHHFSTKDTIETMEQLEILTPVIPVANIIYATQNELLNSSTEASSSPIDESTCETEVEVTTLKYIDRNNHISHQIASTSKKDNEMLDGLHSNLDVSDIGLSKSKEQAQEESVTSERLRPCTQSDPHHDSTQSVCLPNSHVTNGELSNHSFTGDGSNHTEDSVSSGEYNDQNVRHYLYQGKIGDDDLDFDVITKPHSSEQDTEKEIERICFYVGKILALVMSDDPSSNELDELLIAAKREGVPIPNIPVFSCLLSSDNFDDDEQMNGGKKEILYALTPESTPLDVDVSRTFCKTRQFSSAELSIASLSPFSEMNITKENFREKGNVVVEHYISDYSPQEGRSIELLSDLIFSIPQAILLASSETAGSREMDEFIGNIGEKKHLTMHLKKIIIQVSFLLHGLDEDRTLPRGRSGTSDVMDLKNPPISMSGNWHVGKYGDDADNGTKATTFSTTISQGSSKDGTSIGRLIPNRKQPVSEMLDEEETFGNKDIVLIEGNDIEVIAHTDKKEDNCASDKLVSRSDRPSTKYFIPQDQYSTALGLMFQEPEKMADMYDRSKATRVSACPEFVKYEHGNDSYSDSEESMLGENPPNIGGVSAAARMARIGTRRRKKMPIRQQWRRSYDERVSGHAGYFGIDVYSIYESTSVGAVAHYLDPVPWEYRDVRQGFLHEKSLVFGRNWFGDLKRTKGNHRYPKKITHPKSLVIPFLHAAEAGTWPVDWYTTWQSWKDGQDHVNVFVTDEDGVDESFDADEEDQSNEKYQRLKTLRQVKDTYSEQGPEIGTLFTMRLKLGAGISQVNYNCTSSYWRSRWRRKYFPSGTFPYN